MGIVIKNITYFASISLTTLKLVGFWPPEFEHAHQRLLYGLYTACFFMFTLGTYLIVQIVDLFLIWGDVALMTSASFLLFTNLSQTTKIVIFLKNHNRILDIVNDADNDLRGAEGEEALDIIKRCNKEHQAIEFAYFVLAIVTTTGWAASADKGELPLRAWYPYDTSVSPAFELTYCHQVVALLTVAWLNVCKDVVITSLIAQCRCRLTLVSLSLKTLGWDLMTPNKFRLTPEEETQMYAELVKCVKKHEAALKSAKEIQACFSVPILAQLFVSTVIMCLAAYQLVMALNEKNWGRIVSMGAYLLCMMLQLFMMCYEGHLLSEESSEVSDAAYECPWYACSVRVRRAILIVMLRSRQIVVLKGCGITTLSLDSYAAIVKASYTFFTVLRQMENRN